MQCQECQKRPATLHFTQVINGNKKEIQLCNVCAKEKGYMTYPEDGYSLQHLLSGLFNFDSNPIGSGSNFQKVKELKCPKCEMSFSEFKRIGKFGCAHCYEEFSSKLEPIFRRVHSGNTKHRGKIPTRKGGNLHLKKEIEQYKTHLQELIINEEFEKAADVRDQIKELELILRNKQDGD